MPSRLTHPPSSVRDKCVAGQRTAGAQDLELHTDAALDKQGKHMDATLDKSGRQSVTTGLWQFSDREELHEVGGNTSTSGNLHLRIPLEVYLRRLSRQQVIWINNYPRLQVNGQARRMTALHFSRWINAVMIKDYTRTALASQGSYSHWVSGPLTLVNSYLRLQCTLKGQTKRTAKLLFSHWIGASRTRNVEFLWLQGLSHWTDVSAAQMNDRRRLDQVVSGQWSRHMTVALTASHCMSASPAGRIRRRCLDQRHCHTLELWTMEVLDIHWSLQTDYRLLSLHGRTMMDYTLHQVTAPARMMPATGLWSNLHIRRSQHRLAPNLQSRTT